MTLIRLHFCIFDRLLSFLTMYVKTYTPTRDNRMKTQSYEIGKEMRETRNCPELKFQINSCSSDDFRAANIEYYPLRTKINILKLPRQLSSSQNYQRNHL